MPTELDTRGDPNDVAAVRLDTPIQQNQQYTVVSAVSTATNSELRSAGEDYPQWVRDRYLQLPRSLPRQVVDLSHDVINGAPDGFDKATAIESYLRDNFTYPTHVGPVPPDRDWVDYFLFESGQGYCDYFATAMVVMLRAEGVPARVASGFAPRRPRTLSTGTVRLFGRTTRTAGSRHISRATAGSPSSRRRSARSRRAWRTRPRAWPALRRAPLGRRGQRFADTSQLTPGRA